MPLPVSFSSVVGLTHRQGCSTECRQILTPRTVNWGISGPRRVTLPGGQEYRSRYGCGFLHCWTFLDRTVSAEGCHDASSRFAILCDVINLKKKNPNSQTNSSATTPLMPPPHRILASRLRGYVCRACLSKSQFALQQKPPWLSRNATNGRRRRSRSRGAQEDVDRQIPEIRLFEQTPDGRRVEIKLDDPLEGVEEMFREYEKDKDKSMEELGAPLDFESFQNGNGDHNAHLLDVDESLTDFDKDDEELDALMERLDNIDFNKLSSEDRAKLREEVLRTATNGM